MASNLGGPTATMQSEAWDWTVRALEDLKALASKADTFARNDRITLTEKLALQAIAKRARDGLFTVATVFADAKGKADG
jgi:hypothetical protein